MQYSFLTYGHPNITARHKNTLEFTKDKELTKRGDCILGVNSDFDLEQIKRIVSNHKKIKITLKSGNMSEEISADANQGFNDEREIVVRKTGFISKRTLGINADKACVDLDKELISLLKNPESKIYVTIS